LPENTHKDPAAFQTNIVIPFLKYCWKHLPIRQVVPWKNARF
jgi:hypothetical protein